MNKFEIYLQSVDSLNGITTPYNTNFNMRSVRDANPSIHNSLNKNHCKVKIDFFSIKKTNASFKTDGISHLVIKINTPLINSVESNTITAGDNNNIIQSRILGIINLHNDDYTYNNESRDNEYVCSSNIFNGDINIQLCDEDGDLLTSSEIAGANTWKMLLCVYFDDY
mgnify:FL=1